MAAKFFDKSLLTLKDEVGKLNMFDLAIPIFFGQVCNILLGTVNTLALNRVSDDAVTAVNVTNTVINIPAVILNMIASGVLVLISIALGATDKKQAAEISTSGVTIATAGSVIISVVMYLLAEPILSLMNLSGKILAMGVIYLKIRSVFLLFTGLTNVITAILRANGSSVPTMAAGIIANAVNAMGSLFVVSSLYSGNKIAGVAISAAAGQLCGALYAIVSARKVNFAHKFVPSCAIHILKVGVPSGVSSLAYTLSAMYSTALLASLGKTVVNLKVYATTISNYTYLFGYAIAQATAIMIGRHLGAGNIKKANRLYWQTARQVPMLNCLLSLCVFIFSDKIMRIFTSDGKMIETAHIIFLIDIVIEIARGFTHVGENSLCSAEDTFFTSVVSVTACLVIGMLVCRIFTIDLKLGLYGYYLAAIIDEGTRGIVYAVRWKKGKQLRRFTDCRNS